MSKYILAITACPESDCQNLAQVLVRNHLCACVNIIPYVKSIYHWKNEIVTDTESILLMKTEEHLEDELWRTIKRHHPYEVPEFLVLNISSGSKSYLDWISNSVSNHQD